MNSEEIRKRILENSQRLEAPLLQKAKKVPWRKKVHVTRDFFKKRNRQFYWRYKKLPKAVRRVLLLGIIVAGVGKGAPYLAEILRERAAYSQVQDCENLRNQEIQSVDQYNDQIKNELQKRYVISDRESFDKLYQASLPLIQLSLFSVECCAFEPYSVKGNSVLDTGNIGLCYYPIDGNPDNSKWIKLSSYVAKNGVFRDDMKKSFRLTDSWFTRLEEGAVCKEMYSLLKGAELTPHEFASICAERYASKACGRSLCKFVRENYKNPVKCAQKFLSYTASESFPGLNKRRLMEALLYLNEGNFASQMYGFTTQKVKLKHGGDAYTGPVNDMKQGDVSRLWRAVASGNIDLILAEQNKVVEKISSGGQTIYDAICLEINDEEFRDNVLKYCFKEEKEIGLEDAIELAAIETASLNMKPTKKRVALNMLISSIRNRSNAN